MEPQYFLENRYSFVMDFQPHGSDGDYAVDSPETRFEYQVQRKLAVANRLLTAGKFTAAKKKYEDLRGLIIATLKPTVSPIMGALLDWNKMAVKDLALSLIGKSAAMLKATPYHQTALPDYVRAPSGKLSRELEKHFAPLESAGVRDDQEQLGLHLSDAGKLVDAGKFEDALVQFEVALELAKEPEMGLAIRHDIAVMQERTGNRDKAVDGLQRVAEAARRIKDVETEALAVSTLVGTLVRGGKADKAKEKFEQLRKIRDKGNLFPVISGKAAPIPLARSNGQIRSVASTVTPGFGFSEPRVSPITGAPVPPLSAPFGRGLQLAAPAWFAETLDLAVGQPAFLLTTNAYQSRQGARIFTVLDGNNAPVKIDVGTNEADNLASFFDVLRVTADLSLLNAYAVAGPTAVAYLTHISLWIIPMSLGDCYTGLGWYSKAEEEYRKTLDYPFLNEVVEVVNLWLRLAELYNDWGDHLYRQARNDISEFSKARKKYEQVISVNDQVDNNSPLYKHSQFAKMKARATAAITMTLVGGAVSADNPRLLIALMRARMQLSKIKAKLNYLGMGVYVPPFSFEYMQNVARYFAQHAAQVEQMYIQFQSGGENEELRETQMSQQVALSDASVDLEQRGLEEALEGVNVAQENEQHAAVQEANARDARNNFNAVKWDLLELSSIQAWSSAAAVDEDDEVKQTVSGFSSYSSDSRRRSMVLYDLARERGRISNELETARLQREIAAADAYRDVAQAQVGQAEARVDVAEARIALAEMQKQHAQENLAFLAGREFSSAMWYNLARETRRISGRYLDMAIEVAILMEKAYEAETGRDLRKIKFEYGSNQLNGMLGSDTLLLDIDYFSFDHLRMRSKKAPMRQTISMSDQFPMAFERLMRTGTTYFETTLDHFDRRYPGFYLQKVKQVELVFVGLNGTEGVHGTLRNIGLSKVRRKNGTIENQIYPADVMPLSEYNVRQDAVIFQLDSKELRLFENNGVATMWQLDLPLSSNAFNMRNILDIELVVYYDGFHAQALENQIVAALPTSGSASRGLSLKLYAPDELFFLRGQGNAQLAITPDLFPANQVAQKLKSYSLQALGESVAGLKIDVAYEGLGQTHQFELDAQGMATQADFAAPVGQSLFDTLSFTIDAAQNPGFNLSNLDDLSLFVEYDFDYRS